MPSAKDADVIGSSDGFEVMSQTWDIIPPIAAPLDLGRVLPLVLCRLPNFAGGPLRTLANLQFSESL